MLGRMTPLTQIINELNKSSKFKQCTAVESNGNLCFNKIYGKNLCQKHYQRLIRNNTINLIKKEKKCKFIDCNSKYWAKGYCKKHYKKYVKHVKSKLKCSVENCSKSIHAKLMCNMHYLRLYTSNSLEKKKQTDGSFKGGSTRKNIKCIVPNCLHTYESSQIVKGLCNKHYQKWRKYGHY